tara:strand:- start:141 stop:2237 length:2097 start_codon:yes stop_codon:yes gene_type:complete
MADFNKSVEITLKANIKQLQKNLEQIPGMTKKEASKMVRALSSEFNKAQKAAKKAAEESRKAAKASAKAFEESSEKIGESFKSAADEAATAAKEIKVSFEDAAEETNVLAENSEAVATAFGSATLALDKLAPGMSETTKNALEMADGLATAAEQAIKGGPATMALTAAIVAGAAAYELYTKSSRMAAEQQKRLAEAQKLANEKLDEQFSIVQNITGDFKNANREYQLLTGQITQLEFDLMTARDRSTAKTQQELEIQQKRVKEQQRLVRILEKARVSTNNLSDQEKELLNTAMATSKIRSVSAGLTGQESVDQITLIKFKSELLGRLQKEKDFASAITRRRKEALKEEEKLIRAKDELAKEQEKEKALDEKKAKREKQRAKDAENLKAVLAEIEEIEQVTQQAKERNASLSLSMLSPEEQIRKSTSDQVSARRQQTEDLKGQVKATQILAQTEASREAARESEAIAQEAIGELLKEIGLIEMQGQKELDALKEQNHKREQERKDKEKKEAKETERERIAAIRREAAEIGEIGNLTIGTFRNSIETIQNVSKAAGVENAGLIRALFEMNRVAAIGEIAFNTAKAVTAAGALGPLAPLAIAAATTAAAAQTASVLSQQPPKLHMGGMTPDERTVIVKTGEAVLDSSTVNRIGGEPGVRALQNGQGSSPQVIVMNPFKHFDRYMTDRQRAGLSTRSSRRSY